MTGRSLRICIGSGLAGMALFGIGMWPLAHFIPLLDPTSSAEEIARIYQSNTIGIRLGGLAIMFGASLSMTFFGAMYVFVKRMEGDNGPYAVTQAICAAVIMAFVFLPGLLFTVVAFRPERAAELTLLMNDFAWILLVIPTPPAVVQTFAIAFAILGDRNPQPVLPRWTGYFSAWIAVLLVPGSFAMMFKTGPFAWNGILAFWLPALSAGIWLIVMCVQMLKSIRTSFDT